MAETTNYKLKKPTDNENADIADINDNMDIIDAALKQVSDKTEETAATKGNAGIIIKTDVSVATSTWSSDTTYEEFPNRAAVAITDCTTEHKPDVTFGVEDATGGNFAPIAEAYGGGVYIYAKEIPEEDVTIPTITLLKEVKK